MNRFSAFKTGLTLRADVWIQCLGLVLLSSVLAFIWLLVHYLQPAPFHLFNDPEMAYMMDSLGIFKGKLYDFIQHPGTPVELIGSFLLLLTYPFLSRNFILYHLQHPEIFMAMARGLLTLAHIVGCTLLARYAIRITHWTDALFSLAIPASFYALSDWLGFRAVIVWDHNSFALPAGSVLLLAVLVTFRSGAPVRMRRIMSLGFCTGALTATQLYFVTWIIGLIVTVASFHLLHKDGWIQTIRSSIYVSLAAILGFVVATLPILNHYGDLINWVKGIIFHQGTYGLGEPGIASFQMISANLIHMWTDNPGLCIAVPLVLTALGLERFYRTRLKQDERNPGLSALACGISTQLILTIAIILKHYGRHYLLAVAAIVPLLLALVHSLALGARDWQLRLFYGLVSIAVFIAFMHNLVDFVNYYDDVFSTTRSAQEKSEKFFKEYAVATEKDEKLLKVLWSINTSSSCFARWHNSRAYHGIFDEEISRICPRDFYLLLYSPYVYWSGHNILLDDFDWDLMVVAEELLPQWPYLMDYGYVSPDGRLIFIANWKKLNALSRELVQGDYHGYQIFRLGRRFFFGVPQSEGQISFERLSRGDYRELVEGTTLKEVQDRIAALSAPPEDVQTLTLITEWYRGYRIFRLRARFYGIEYGDVQLDLNRFSTGGHANGVEGATFEEVKDHIDALLRPQVVARDYRGYDIIRLGQSFYGVQQSESGFDLKQFHMGKYKNYVKASSIDEARRGIDALVPEVQVESGRQPAARLHRADLEPNGLLRRNIE